MSMKQMKKLILTFLVGCFAIGQLSAQVDKSAEEKAEYRKVVTGRADKIVADLGIADSSKYGRVREIIAQQYIDLNEIHDGRNASVKALKETYKENKEAAKPAVEKVEKKADKKLGKLHKKYIAKLNKELTAGQVEMVKDGMTYKVLPITYKGYMEMLPNITQEQKKQILVYLTEAREHAMDAESSEKKHGWFGKYKGRINNYLSAAGIDMNKASKEWQQRIKAEAQNKAGN